jgi:hypothetical protein
MVVKEEKMDGKEEKTGKEEEIGGKRGRDEVGNLERWRKRGRDGRKRGRDGRNEGE